MTFRSGPIRSAAIIAAGFVVARVVYRVLFHGADGAGLVLVALPEVRLPAPFAHVVLLGPVTTDGLSDAAASAVPIALAILAFGVLNALIDVSRLFARAARRGPLRGVARALAIAWATLPSLADGARAVRFAQRLRHERGGARMLLPLLQRTLERAGAIAAALELRGFAGRGIEGDCLTPVEARGVEIGHGAGAGVARVRLPSDLTLDPGTLTVVSGPTGSGKSTLLRALAGLHSHTDGGWIAGSLRVVGHDRVVVPPRELARCVGVVLQHPREAFATDRVREEIGLALELRDVATVVRAARVAEIAARVGISDLLDRPVRGLSAGEATLVAIAAAIVEHPILLLVDEPLADLDAVARGRITGLLGALAHEAGMCVVVAEHRVGALTEVADGLLRIEDGAIEDADVTTTTAPGAPGLVAAFDAGPEHDSDVRGTAHATPADVASGALPAAGSREAGVPGATASREVVLSAHALTVRHRDTVAVAGADLVLHAGELVALVGPNGAGKSSLLAALALPERDARVASAGRVALIPDASDDLFLFDTVREECARADRRAAPRRRVAVGDPRKSAARFAGFVGRDVNSAAFASLLARHPLDLSVGERRCLALAIQLSSDPSVLMIDEPTRGLDPAARDVVWAALSSLAADGTAVLVASHDPAAAALADRVLEMRAGVLAAAAAPVGSRAEDRSAHARGTLGGATGGTVARAAGETVAPSGPVAPEHRTRPDAVSAPPMRLRLSWQLAALAAANVTALGAFCWPLIATAVPEQAHAAVPIAALALTPLAVLVVVATLDGTVRSAHLLALLGTLAAIGAAVRIASTGVGGVEALFILLILAGRAFGARFGMLLGMATIALSTLVTGTFGPWTPFQMFACAWVGAGAGLLPRRVGPRAEIALLSVYGVVASYLFGLLMNLWFWPFAVGFGSGISYDGTAPIGMNLSSFLLYSLVTSTLGWDTLRAVTTVVGLVVIGRPVLAALRRSKPLRPAAPPQLSRIPRGHAATHPVHPA